MTSATTCAAGASDPQPTSEDDGTVTVRVHTGKDRLTTAAREEFGDSQAAMRWNGQYVALISAARVATLADA
jgi:hypothetical protein